MAATSPPRGTTPRTTTFLPAFAAVLVPENRDRFSPDVVLTNLLLTLLVVLLFGLASSVFNGTIDDNRVEIGRWYAGLAGSLAFRTRRLRRWARAPGGQAARARLSATARPFTILLLTGLIYGFLSPDFGLNAPSVVLFVALVIGQGLITYVSEGGSTLLARRRYGLESSVRVFGAAIVVAIGCVLFSRITNFEPGFLYGFVASGLILSNVTLDRRRSAALVIVPALILLAVSLVAWVLMPAFDAAAQDGNLAAVLAATVAATVFVCGLEGLFYNMIPLAFMDGAVLYRWNRFAWAVMFGTVTFFFWQLVINQYNAFGDALGQTSVAFCLAVLAIFGAVTATTWGYFRYRRRLEPTSAE